VKQERRDCIPATPGELNYQITQLVRNYLLTHPNYNDGLNAVMGALMGVLLEMYRRKAVPYEDKKIEENGDAW
jgi:hypothetical protein